MSKNDETTSGQKSKLMNNRIMENNIFDFVYEEIGHVNVDAGMIMVGDACYFMGDSPEAKKAYPTWSHVVGEVHEGEHQLCYEGGGEGLGVMAQTAYGDGSFPVIALKERADSEDPTSMRTHGLLVLTSPEAMNDMLGDWRANAVCPCCEEPKPWANSFEVIDGLHEALKKQASQKN